MLQDLLQEKMNNAIGKLIHCISFTAQLFLEPPNTTSSGIAEVHSWTLIQLVNGGKGILTPIWPFPSEKDSSS